MKETIRTEWNKTYTRENNIITLEREERLSISASITYWLATDTQGNTLAKADYYTNSEVDTIERLLQENGYTIVKRVASVPNSTIFEKTF